MKPLAIHHVSVNVSDVDAALAFYTGTLGGTRRDDRPDFGIDGAWVDLGGQQVHLIGATVPPDLGQHFAIQVEDLDSVVAELRSGGLEVGGPTPVGSSRQAFVHDPDGNLVEIHQVGQPA